MIFVSLTDMTYPTWEVTWIQVTQLVDIVAQVKISRGITQPRLTEYRAMTCCRRFLFELTYFGSLAVVVVTPCAHAFFHDQVSTDSGTRA